MSHLTTMKIQIKDKRTANKIAKRMGWTVDSSLDVFVNPYSHEKVENPTIYKDAKGKVKMVTDKKGTVHVDTWEGGSIGMGRDFEKFLQSYASEQIQEVAAMDWGIQPSDWLR